jgi:hypothetical protein
VDLIILSGLPLSVADLVPGGQNVCDTSKLGCKVVDSLIDLSRGIKGYLWEIEPFGFYSYKVTVYRVPALPWHFSGLLAIH